MKCVHCGWVVNDIRFIQRPEEGNAVSCGNYSRWEEGGCRGICTAADLERWCAANPRDPFAKVNARLAEWLRAAPLALVRRKAASTMQERRENLERLRREREERRAKRNRRTN